MDNKRFKTSSLDATQRRMSAEVVLSKVDSLPTLSMVAIKVGELINDPNVSAAQIAAALQDDPSLSAKVLKLVNSPYYAIPGGVSDVQRAISFVGFNTLHQLVLSASVLGALKTPQGSRFNATGLWLHSLAVGACAEVIAGHLRHKDPGSCFTAGLLHDIGKIALAKAVPERFGMALDEAARSGVPMSIAEKNAGLPSHDRVGSQLGRHWKFPASLLMPIEHHHNGDAERVRRSIAPGLLSMVDIVAVADELARCFHLGDSGSPEPERVGQEALERVGLTTIGVDKVYSDLMRKLEISKTFLDLIDGEDDKTIEVSAPVQPTSKLREP